MIETSARLLRLLSVLQARRDWTGPELAERLGVTVRTVRRDVDKLRGLGYPVNAIPGTGGGYTLGAGAALPPLLLDDDEAVAVAVGLRTAAAGTVTGLEETSLRALAKLEHVLPPRLWHRVDSLQFATVLLAGGAPTVDPGTLTAIAVSCREHHELTFDYRAHDGTDSRRMVQPHRLVHTSYRWYLLAWDTDREDWRTFRVDRIAARPSSGDRFVPRTPPMDVAAFVSQGVASAPYRYQARILIHAPLDVVAGQTPATAGWVEAVDDTTCLLYTGSDSLDQLALHLGSKGADFVVLDPPELVEHVRMLAERFHHAVQPTVSSRSR